jgi:hypothetical protein
MKRTKLHIDQFLLSDPFELGPADIGTDRPVIDPEAQDAAERNARATELAARPDSKERNHA